VERLSVQARGGCVDEEEIEEKREEVQALVRKFGRRVREVKREAREERRDRKDTEGDRKEPKRLPDYLDEGVYDFSVRRKELLLFAHFTPLTHPCSPTPALTRQGRCPGSTLGYRQPFLCPRKAAPQIPQDSATCAFATLRSPLLRLYCTFLPPD
jgi:hypothetical protein